MKNSVRLGQVTNGKTKTGFLSFIFCGIDVRLRLDFGQCGFRVRSGMRKEYNTIYGGGVSGKRMRWNGNRNWVPVEGK